jgi:hypothetical protein
MTMGFGDRGGRTLGSMCGRRIASGAKGPFSTSFDPLCIAWHRTFERFGQNYLEFATTLLSTLLLFTVKKTVKRLRRRFPRVPGTSGTRE